MNPTVSTHRNQVQVASGLNLLAAVWLFVSAFAIHGNGSMTTSNAACAIAVAILAGFRAFGAYDQAWLSWVNALIGAWVVVSPWAVAGQPGPGGPTQAMIINNCLTGGVVLVLGVWSPLATNTEPGGTTDAGTAAPSFGR